MPSRRRLAPIVPLGIAGKFLARKGRAPVTLVDEHNGRGRTEEHLPSRVGTRRGGLIKWALWRMPPSGARTRQVWQRRGLGIQTDPTAPVPTGLPLNGMHPLGSLGRRCPDAVDGFTRRTFGATRGVAAARELPVGSVRCQPRTLSAIHHPQVSPTMSDPGRRRTALQNLWFIRASLCPMRTPPPQPGNRQSFHRTHTALPGAAGVDTKKGAAIHPPVAPEESA